MRVLLAKYRGLFAWEREIGTDAPFRAGWHVRLAVPKASRHFETVLGTCDVQELIVDAIDLCTKDPRLQSFYGQYTPLYQGRVVSFRTWFCQRLRSRAGLCIKTWKRQRGYVTPLPEQSGAHQRTHVPRKPADYWLSAPRRHAGDTTRGPEDTLADDTLAALAIPAKAPVQVGEPVAAFLARGGRIRRVPARPAANFPADLAAARATQLWLGRRQPYPHTPRTARKEPDYSPASRAWEARHDLQQLVARLTVKEQQMLDCYLDFGCMISKKLAATLGYEQYQVRNKISYIKKKLKKYVKSREIFPHYHAFGE